MENDRIFELWEYLNNKGYHASSENLVEFHEFIGTLPFCLELKNMEPYIKIFVVKNVEQETSFHSDFQYFLSNYKSIRQEIDDKKKELEKKYKTIEENANKRKTEIEKCKKEIDKYKEEKSEIEKSIQQNMKKEYDKVSKQQKEIMKLTKNMDSDIKKSFEKLFNKEPLSLNETIRLQNVLPELLKAALKASNMASLLNYIKDLKKYIEKYIKELSKYEDDKEKRLESKLKKLEKEQEREQKLIDNKIELIKEELEKEIYKKTSQNHRPEFQTKGNSVKSKNANAIMNKQFNKLSKNEKEEIEQYIFENIRIFKTRLSRKIKGKKRKELDLSETCKKACSTNGIPLNLCFKKPVRDRAKLMLFLDVSGSCSNASELMLTFAYYLQEAFPAGCKCYAFTNKLYDISKLLDMPNGGSAVKKVLSAIPRSGAYSDYNKPLKDFYENHMHEITKDTICIFIGDARNNKNKSGEEYLKAICRKCKKSWWMNTESVDKWNINDSIIGIYEPYLNKLDEVLTPHDVLDFILR